MMIVLRPSIARAARAYTGLTQKELAERAGLASKTVNKSEKDGRSEPATVAKLLVVLEGHGVIMLYDDQGAIKGMEFKQTTEGHAI